MIGEALFELAVLVLAIGACALVALCADLWRMYGPRKGHEE